MTIELNGKPLEQITKERQDLAQAAMEFISLRKGLLEQSIIDINAKIESAKSTTSPPDVEKEVTAISTILQEIRQVSAATGVEYYFEGCDEYSSSSEGPLGEVEDIATTLRVVFGINSLDKAADKCCDMRYAVQQWNASSC